MLHLIKLCVGAESVEDLATWQRANYGRGPARHVTRMWPKREAEILEGGSLYWVIKGVITCRQRILSLDEVTGADGIRRCAIILDPEITRVSPAPKRAFQGWRYLTAADAPVDLMKAKAGEDTLPPELSAALADIGIL